MSRDDGGGRRETPDWLTDGARKLGLPAGVGDISLSRKGETHWARFLTILASAGSH